MTTPRSVLITAAYIVGAVLLGAFWAGVLFVIAHFIAKFW